MEIYDYIQNIKTFKDFYDKLVKIENKNVKGTIFEQFAKLYFNHFNYFDKYYVYDDIPSDIKQKLNLPSNDKGIDALGIKKNKYFGIQIKFMKQNKLCISKLGTFYACLHNKDIKDIIFTSAKEIDNNINCSEIICYENLENNCNEKFWNSIRTSGANGLQSPLTNIIYNLQSFPSNNNLQNMHDILRISDNKKLICSCSSIKNLSTYWLFTSRMYNKICVFQSDKESLIEVYENWNKETNAVTNKHTPLIVCKTFPDKNVTRTVNKAKISEFMKNNNIIVFATYKHYNLLTNYDFDNTIYEICSPNKPTTEHMDVIEKLINDRKTETIDKIINDNIKHLNIDSIDKFIDSCCTFGKSKKISADELYVKYKKYCEINSIKPVTNKKFDKLLLNLDKDIEKKDTKNGIVYQKISVKN